MSVLHADCQNTTSICIASGGRIEQTHLQGKTGFLERYEVYALQFSSQESSANIM